jgi:hypothetical protein
MPTTDSERERWRLAQLYGGMADGELEQLAREAFSLSETARRALKFELSRRELKVELQVSAAAPEAKKFSKLVTIRQFRDVPEAYLAKGVLDSANIENFLFDANIVGMNWLWSNAVGGVKLRVREEDAEEAAALLNQGSSSESKMENIEEWKSQRRRFPSA